MKAWLKGGIIGVIIFAVIEILFSSFVFGNPPTINYLIPIYNLINYIYYPIDLLNINNIYLDLLTKAVYFAVIGAIIGFIFRSRKKQKSEEKEEEGE